MSRNRFLMLILFVMALLWVVPLPALAQVTELDFDDILASLGPRNGRALLYDIFLYLIFFVAFINQFLIPDKQLLITVANFLVMGTALAVKLLVPVPVQACGFIPANAIFAPDDLAVFLMNVVMFALPLLMAGGSRSVKGKPSKAVMPSVFLALLGGGYFFLFWLLDQRPCSEIFIRTEIYLPLESMMVLGVFSLGALRNRLRMFKR